MRYVTTLCRWGRLGHQFTDLTSAFIISETFGLTYLHSGYRSTHHINQTIEKWEGFTNLGDGEPKYLELKDNLSRLTYSRSWNEEKRWWGIESYQTVFDLVNAVKDNTVLEIADSSWIILNNLYVWENQGKVSGVTNRLRARLKNKYDNSIIVRNAQSDFENWNATTVGIVVRGAGKFEDSEYDVPFEEYEEIIEAIRAVSNRQLKIIVYSQGPKEIIDKRFFKYDVRISDEEYPRLYNIFKSLVDCDVFIGGQTSFSNVISFYRNGPSIYPRSANFKLCGITRHPQDGGLENLVL